MGNPVDRMLMEDRQQTSTNPVDAMLSNQARPEPQESLAVRRSSAFIDPFIELGDKAIGVVRNLPAAFVATFQRMTHPTPQQVQIETQAAHILGRRITSAASALGVLIRSVDPLRNPGDTQKVLAKANQVVEGVYNTLRTQVDDVQKDPVIGAAKVVSIAPMVAGGIVSMATDALEAITQTSLGRYDEAQPLAAIELTQKRLNTLGNIAAIPVGVGVSKALGAASVSPIIREAFASGLTPEALVTSAPTLAGRVMNLGVQEAIMATKERLLHGTLGGLTGGATFGAFEGLGQDDMVDKMVNYALVGAPLGVAMEFAFGTKVNHDRMAFISGVQNEGRNQFFNSNRALILNRLRALNVHETQNFGDVIGAMAALDNNRNLARAVLDKTLNQPSRVVLTNVDAATAQRALFEMEASDYSRLRSFGMSADDARSVAFIRRGLVDDTFSAERPKVLPKLGPINELTIDKVIAKARSDDAHVQAEVLNQLLGESKVRDIQFHGTRGEIIGGKLIPTEGGIHLGTSAAANRRAGIRTLSSAQELVRTFYSFDDGDMVSNFISKEGQKFPEVSKIVNQAPIDIPNNLQHLGSIESKVNQLNALPKEKVQEFLNAYNKYIIDAVGHTSSGHVFPFFINVKNPIELIDAGDFLPTADPSFGRVTVLQQLVHKNILTETEANNIRAEAQRIEHAQKVLYDRANVEYFDAPFPATTAAQRAEISEPLISALEAKGYDAFSYKNSIEDVGSTSYAVFNPDNIHYLDEILKAVQVEKPSEKFRAIMDLREMYEFYPNDFSAKSNIPSFAVRANPDGTFHIAFSSGMEQFTDGQLIRFQKTGWMQGEHVNYRGKVAYLDAIIGEDEALTPHQAKILNDLGISTENAPKVQARIKTAEGYKVVNLDEITRSPEPVARLRELASELVYEKFIERNFKAPARTENNSKLVDAVPVRKYTMLKRFEKASPNYGKYKINFESDFDRATYIAYSSNAEGKRNPTAIRNHLKETTGLTDAELKEHRDAVVASLRDVTSQHSGVGKVTLPRVTTKLESVQRAIRVAEVAETIPTKSWNQMVKEFAEAEGYNPTDIPDLSRQLSGRFMREISEHQMSQMNDLELNTFKQVRQTITDMLNEPLGEIDNLGKLDLTLRANGQYIEAQPGAIIVRDVMTGKELYRGRDVKSVLEAGKKTGATTGINGDGGNNGIGVPPVDAIPPSGNPSPGPFRVTDDPDTLVAKVRKWSDLTRAFSKRGNFFAALEKEYKLPFYEQAYNRIQKAAEKVNAEIHRLMKPVYILENSGLSASDRLLVTDYLETYSADELRKDGWYQGKPLTQIEQDLGTELGSSTSIDIRKVHDYTAILDRSYATMTPQDFALRMGKAATDLMMNADELRFVEKLKQSGEVSHASIYAFGNAIRGDIMGTPFLSREQFAVERKMSPKLLRVANEIAKLYEAYGDEFGVPKEMRLNRYTTHKRIFGIDDYQLLGKDALDINDTAYFKLRRSGLLDEYERDPYYALQAYIRAGLNEKYLAPEVQRAAEFFNSPTVKEAMPATEHQYALENFESYVRDIRGIPGENTQLWNQRAQKLLKKLGLGDDLRRVATLTNGWTDTAYQGGSAYAAVRDLLGGYFKASSYFGFTDGAQIISKATIEATKKVAGKPNIITELIDKGIVRQQSLSPLETVDQAGASFSNVQSSRLVRGIEKVERFGLVTSGQPLVFEALQAATYQHVWEKIGRDLKLWKDGELSQRQVVNRNSLEKYDTAVLTEFNRLVTEDKFQEASEYLAREGVALINDRYGLGNAPYGWTNPWMRLTGQYGQYAIGHKSFVLRGLSQGTVGQRAAFAARYAAINGALIAAGYWTGTNLFWRFAPITGLGYGGGPAKTAVESLVGGISSQYGFTNGVDYAMDILPYNTRGWNLDHPHGWLPFSKAITDYNRALWMIADDRGSATQQILSPLGIKPSAR